LTLSEGLGTWSVLALIMFFIFVIGFFLDFIEITFIHVPVLAPIMIELGIDPVWLCILIAVNLQTSFMTPPFGFSLFYLKAVTPPGVTIANPDTPIVTLTDDKASIEMRCTVERGRGYVPSEARDNEQRDIGTIALDAVFTPVERVSFKVENARVGQDTDYHKLLITIATDGTVTPKDALNQAASILADHFAELTGDFADKLTDERPEEIKFNCSHRFLAKLYGL